MISKDFVAFAKEIKLLKEVIPNEENNIFSFAKHMAEYFRSRNEKFHRDRFLNACGF